MNPTETRQLGSTGVTLSQLGLGCAPFGELFVKISDADTTATLQTAWNAGLRFFDTAPFYGMGLSEHRVGTFLREQPRDQYILSTKVGRILQPQKRGSALRPSLWTGGLPFEDVFDYSYDGIIRSYEDSLQRLGIPWVDCLIIHDLDQMFHSDPNVEAHLTQLVTSGWRALEELKRSGLVGAVGAGVNELGTIPRFLDAVPLDFFLLAMRYTLMEQDTLDEELPKCEAGGVGIVIGAVFNSGILATGPVEGAKYNYEDATPAVMEKVRRIQAICGRYDVPLPAAALQFPLGNPAVASVIPGAFKPEQIAASLDAFRNTIPTELWTELKSEGLLREDAPTPG
jgi:D-threo-aldose 1-dehydrogenase